MYGPPNYSAIGGTGAVVGLGCVLGTVKIGQAIHAGADTEDVREILERDVEAYLAWELVVL
jgi:hypothetical protein